MLSFELKRSWGAGTLDELEIHCDSKGLATLMAQLQLLGAGRTDHLHLMARSWGGEDLDDNPHNAVNEPIKHVKVFFIRGS